jgi:hypothetical protein
LTTSFYALFINLGLHYKTCHSLNGTACLRHQCKKTTVLAATDV